jgi:hypothetical protein
VPLSLITSRKGEPAAFLLRVKSALMTRDALYQATSQQAAELEQAKKRLFQRINASRILAACTHMSCRDQGRVLRYINLRRGERECLCYKGE